MKKDYDIVVVGAGLYGAVIAYEAKKIGKKVLVLDKRFHTGGNIYNDRIEDINVHKYGAHIFHTNDKVIWDYVNQFVEFNRYTNSPVAIHKGRAYNLPFNMNTFSQLWGVTSPQDAQNIIRDQIEIEGIVNPRNLEEQALSLVGRDVYEVLIRGYTQKQWGRDPKDLPAFIIKRLPVRFTYDNNYFNDKFQGIPIGGYNQLTDALFNGIDVRLGVDYFDEREFWKSKSELLVYTGQIDQYFDYKYGNLEYRSLSFQTEVLPISNFQGNAVVNYTELEVPFTRIIEHKHFEFGNQKSTVITREYSKEWRRGDEAYYPVNDEINNARYKNYKSLAENENGVLFGGRLAEYKYYDMHQVIASALSDYRKKILPYFLNWNEAY
jgi:UDP-galactopyranose mutase